MRVLVAGLLAVSMAVAQAAETSKNIRVEGRAVNATGQALPKVLMWLNGPVDIPRVYTDREGRFVFEDVPAGRYTLSAHKAGFVSQSYGTPTATVLDLKPGTELKDLTIRMPLEGVVSGRVTDSDGDPVQGSYVLLMRYRYVQGRRRFERVLQAVLDDRGEYRFSSLPAGRYYVAGSALGDRILMDETREGHVVTFYPSARDIQSATPVDVIAGGELRGIDVRLRREKIFSIKGKAVGIGGAGERGTPSVGLVRADASEVDVLPHTVGMDLRPDGSFEFDSLVAGTYVLKSDGVLIGRQEIVLGGASVENVVFSVRPTPEITGKISLEDGDLRTLIKLGITPVREGLSAVDPNAWPSIRLVAPDEVTGRLGGSFGDDGTFHFFAVGPNKYGLSLIGFPEGIYIKSVRFGGRDVTRAPLDNTPGTGGDLQIMLSVKGAIVTGAVRNEKGEVQAGVAVTVWPKTPDPGSGTGGLQQATTDAMGQFRFASLAPGEFYVAAWEDLDPGLAESAEFVTHFNGDASKVTLAESEKGSVDVRLVAHDRIAAEIAKLP